ncbi:MAG: response regulator transcription factor [Dehalococcoidia bacterium]
MANILVIEDQKQLCQLYGSVLCKTKHKINLAFTGEAGVEQALREPPDLIILDMMLPGISGVDVAKKLWVAGVLPHCSLIVATAVPDQARPITQFCGLSTVLTKPFQIKSLVSAVRHALEGNSPGDAELRPSLAPSG